MEITGREPRTIAEAALAAQILIYELTPRQVSLEDAYMELTRDQVEYQSHPVSQASGMGGPPPQEDPAQQEVPAPVRKAGAHAARSGGTSA
jgi:ABC-2 type transport system ATP-binding protein